ncbi:hypothetical protein TNCV_2909321 [Trichonephila clavipes]|nr:hypothetical protein TNCV_2909321 [Trichonephila clavipes]
MAKLEHILPFAEPESPAGYDPERNHENKQHRSRANCHERLQHEPRIEVDPVQCSDRPRGSVREQLTVEQHHSADEVEAQEHGQGQHHVDGHIP